MGDYGTQNRANKRKTDIFMTLPEIKQAIQQGKQVHYQSRAYKVTKTRDEYLIKCGSHCIGLTWADGITLNGLEKDFFCRESE